MTVIPENKLDLRGNHEGVKLLSPLEALVQHPWAFPSLLRNQVTSRKQWIPPWPQVSALWCEIPPSGRRRERPPTTHTTWRVTYRGDVLVKGLALPPSSGRCSSSEDKPFPLVHPENIPFQSFSTAWLTGSQIEGTFKLFQEHPGRRSWGETGELPLATETWLPGQPTAPCKGPLMWTWKQHLLNAGHLQLHNDFCTSNKKEDVLEIEMN